MIILIIAFLVGYLVWIVGKAWIAAREAMEDFEREEAAKQIRDNR